MFQRIKNRLIVLIIFVLLVFAGTAVYLRLNEVNLIKSFSEEANLSLKTSIINCLSSQNNDAQDLLDNIRLETISSKTGAKIRIIDPEKVDVVLNYLSENPYIIYALVPIEDDNGTVKSILYAAKESSALKQKYFTERNEFLTISITFVFLLLIITAFLFFQIANPISNIIKSFKANRPEQLQKLLKTKSEFGVLANLIKEFFNQKKNLEEEVKVRKITQEELESLNDELEKRVEDRTEELAVTNLELQKERDQTKLYLDIAGTIIALFDCDGYIQLINKKGEEVLGYTQDELNGKNWFDVCFSGKDKKKNKQVHYDVLRNKIPPVEYYISEVITKGKEVKTLIFHNTYLRDSNGVINGILFSAEDITELKLKEKELIEAKEKADESNRLKSTFLANMSHELRTPMVGILGYSDLLSSELQDDTLKNMAKAINESGQRLIDTLNMILDLSRLEANKHNIEYQIINLNELVKSVKFYFEAAAGKKNLFLKTSMPNYDVIARSDGRMLRDVMNNLVNNALKFTQKGGITITLEAFHRNFIITVKDTGIGISQESLGLIFEEFRQASEGLDRGFQGTGLGLTICKKYIELLGGNISVKSTPKVGSEFSIQVPLFTKENSDDSTNQPSEEEALEEIENDDEENFLTSNQQEQIKRKILIVEDDPTSREVINVFLNKVYDVTLTEDGEKALAIVIQKQFDLVIMDINLGTGINGIDTAEKIRNISGYQTVPIIAATAFAMLGDREKFLETGFDHYISKPYLKKQLLDLISDVFSTR